MWHGARDVRVEDVSLPDAPPPGHVRIEVEWCGVCGTDVSEYVAGPILVRGTPHPLTGRSIPVVLGHELSGRVAEADPGSGFGPGDLVTSDAALRCNACEWCLGGRSNVCPLGGSIGLNSDGALAELVDLPAYLLHRVPPDVPADLAALAEPVAVAIHALRRGEQTIGDDVAVFGAGPIGLATVIAARAAGAARIFAVEPNEHRRTIALRLGASDAAAPDEAREVVYEGTEGRGVHVAVESAGSADAAESALRSVRRGGRLVLAGIHKAPATLDLRRIVLYERDVVGALGYAGDLPRALSLIAQEPEAIRALVTARIPLDRVVEEGLEPMAKPDTTQVKVLVSPRRRGA